MKTVEIAIIVFALVFGNSVFAQSFKPGSEPNGFRNVKWGTKLSTLSGMEYCKTSKAGGSLPADQEHWADGKGPIIFFLDIYSKTGDELKVEGVNVEKIEYGFWEKKFCEVTITTRGFKDWCSLKKAILSKFGEGKASKLSFIPIRGIGNLEWHIWLGNVTEMDLFENPSEKNFWMGSSKLRKKALQEVEQKQKGWKQVKLTP